MTQQNIPKKTVYVALSGGVDSSVAASLLVAEGYDVVGVYMRTWSPPGYPCPWKEERHDAARICATLNIPFHTWDFRDAYKKNVVDYLLHEYEEGHTPNPDIMCNRDIKFGLFFDRARAQGADYIATGHYARITQGESYRLLRGVDGDKDQSYFLWTLTQEHLAHTLFPVGAFESKKALRSYAEERGLATHAKKDSQGICFMGPVDVGVFLREYITAAPGPIRTTRGKTIGTHDGLPFYTIGQRKGVGVGGHGPYYVARKEVDTNTLVVAPPADEHALVTDTLHVAELHWIADQREDGSAVEVVTRYRQDPIPARIHKEASGWRVDFDRPVRAITPGQSVVLYDGEVVLGGGIITE